MSKRKPTSEDLLRIIDLCEAVEKKGLDPFEVDINRSLEVLRRYLPQWKYLDELLLDVEALDNLATIVKLQGKWLRHRGSSLYIDPLLVELKIRVSNVNELADAFAKSWHPIVLLNQIAPSRLKQGMNYWFNLTSLVDRNKSDLPQFQDKFSQLSLDELVKLRAIAPEKFAELLMNLLDELKNKTAESELDYWQFISTASFQETVFRAYLTTFLVTESFAQIKIDPIEQKITIWPVRSQKETKKYMHNSVVTSLNFEDWIKTRGIQN